MTEHTALMPQVPGHGSAHFWLMQAKFWGHSELTTHSGLHPGGLPTKLGRHVHTGWLLTSLHWLFGPQGDGWQGFLGVSWITAKIVSYEKSVRIFRRLANETF